MRRIPIRTLIIVLWLGLLGWFLRYEAFPGWFTGTLDGYRGLLREGQIFSDSWMLIQYQKHTIGYSHQQIEMDEKSAAERYRVTSRTSLELNLGGEKQLVNVSSAARLDPFQKLVSFEFSLNARRYSMRIVGRRTAGELFSIQIKSDAGYSTMTVRIPDDVVLYSPMTMMAMGRMKPGETARLKTFDPASMDVASILVKALRREPYKLATNSVDAVVLDVSYQNMSMLTWIDSQGQVLRQETPFGWSMVASTMEEATRSEKGNDDGGDLMVAMGVPVSGKIRDVDACKELTVRLHGIHFSMSDVECARMHVAPETNGTALVTLRADAVEPDGAITPAQRKDALAATSYIQCDHPDMKKQAEAITHGLTNDVEKAIALQQWVFKSVKKNLTVSIPSALDVLRQREGDCNEHTYLYVALARAVGLPAQIRVGIVYKDEGYFYHAWPAVYVGHWLELDPTLDYQKLGVRHLTLLQGELGSQVKLMSALGQLRVDVLDQKY